MNTFKLLSIGIYVAGFLLWFVLWKLLLGYDIIKKIPKLNITLYGGAFAIFANILLAFIAEVPEYSVELGIYTYVERNAITVAGLSLAIATFIIVTFSKVSNVEHDERMHKFLTSVFSAFLLGVLGVLPLYWVPQIYGWLTILRHLKTIPELYSVFILGSAMIIYVDSLSVQGLKDAVLELRK
jgi:hypothetical protein